MVLGALKRNFDVMQIQADGERGIHSAQLDEFCADRKILTMKVGAGQHEAHVERIIRSVKQEVRHIAAKTVPSALPADLITQLVLAAVTSLNCRLTTALTGSLSPHQIWFNTQHIHAEDFDFAFGDLAMAKCPNQKNDIAPRADTVMVLYPIYNGLHGYLVYKFGTQSLVIRNHNTLKHLHWGRADIQHIERLADTDPGGKDLPRRETPSATADQQAPKARPSEPTTPSTPLADASDPVERPPPRDHGIHDAGQPVVQSQAAVAAPVHHDRAPPVHPTAEESGVETERSGVGPTELGVQQSTAIPPPAPAGRGRRGNAGGFSMATSLPAPASRVSGPTGSDQLVTINKISVKQGLRDQPTETLAAIKHELQQMLRLGVFRPMRAEDLTKEQRLRAIYCSMFLKHKYSPEGEFIKCKARLVAGGDLQDKSLYADMSSPTASPQDVLVTGGIAARDNMFAATIDIGGAYLNADISPTGVDVDMVIDAYLAAILVELDPSLAQYLRPNGTLLVRLVKALYGTVEAAKLWYDLIVGLMLKVHFKPNPVSRCVLNRKGPSGKVLTVVLYVDDLLVLCEDEGEILWFKRYLESIFPEVTYHSGKVLNYVGMTLDFASIPGQLKVTMKQSVDDILTTARESPVKLTPSSTDLFDIDPKSTLLGPADEAYFRTFVAKLLYYVKLCITLSPRKSG